MLPWFYVEFRKRVKTYCRIPRLIKGVMKLTMLLCVQADMRLVKLVLRSFGEHEQRGNYTVLYNGEGTLEFGLTHHTIHHDGKGTPALICLFLKATPHFPNKQEK